jgi:hypothetical protein
MSSSRWWSVESKEFGLSVVGGFTGIRIHELRKGIKRSILIDKDEAAWLLKSFHDLVNVLDCRVFWNQAVSGFPRILAQQCANRHGYFLTIEEFEGRRRKGSILVPKGKSGEGWKCFGEELRLAFNCMLAGRYPEHLQGKVVIQSKPHLERGRSYAEVLRTSLPKEKTALFYSKEDSRTRTSSLAKGCYDQKARSSKMATAKHAGSKMEIAFPAKPAGLSFQNPASARSSDSELVSDLRGRGAGYSHSVLPSAPRKPHAGDCLELCSIRKTLESMQEEIRHCLIGLRVLEDEMKGYTSVGFNLSRPNSQMPEGTSMIQGQTKTAKLYKGNPPLQFPIKRPKPLVKPKDGSVLQPIPTRQFALDAGASTSNVQPKSWATGPVMLRPSGKPDFPGRVYQRRKIWNKSSSAVWKVKPGLTISEAGTSQSRVKKAVSSMAGVQDSSPAFEELLCGDSGEPDDLQLADCQGEEVTVSGLGQESNCSPQSGLRSNEAGKATGIEERGFDVGLGISRALSVEGGGLTLDPQVYSQ